MNYYFIVAGVIGVLGSFAHSILGDLWTVAPLDESQIGSPQNTGDQNKRFIRWFWQIGGVVLFSASALFLVDGAGWYDVHPQLLGYGSFLWLSITTIFFALTLKPPVQAFKMVPGLVGIPVNLLILAGLFL